MISPIYLDSLHKILVDWQGKCKIQIRPGRSKMTTKNLLDMFKQADRYDKAAAMWYTAAHIECQYHAERLGVSLDTFVRIVACLSPAVKWEVNINAAVQLVETGDCPYGYKKNRTKAVEILNGNPEALKGPKVTRFYETILNPESAAYHVVVDRWAYRAWTGNVWDTSEVTLSAKMYAQIEADYIEASKQVGLNPGDFQAVVWVVARRLAAMPKGTQVLL